MLFVDLEVCLCLGFGYFLYYVYVLIFVQCSLGRGAVLRVVPVGFYLDELMTMTSRVIASRVLVCWSDVCPDVFVLL